MSSCQPPSQPSLCRHGPLASPGQSPHLDLLLGPCQQGPVEGADDALLPLSRVVREAAGASRQDRPPGYTVALPTHHPQGLPHCVTRVEGTQSLPSGPLWGSRKSTRTAVISMRSRRAGGHRRGRLPRVHTDHLTCARSQHDRGANLPGVGIHEAAQRLPDLPRGPTGSADMGVDVRTVTPRYIPAATPRSNRPPDN